MKRQRIALPAPPPCFTPEFRAMLHMLLLRSGRFRGSRSESARARRAVLSQSGTFVGHRPYARGDDLRRLDWAAYARSGEFYLKQLEEDERRTVTLLLDLSPRLCAGAPPRRLGAMRLAAVIGGLALQRLDGLTVVVPGHDKAPLATFAGAADLDALLRFLEALPYATAALDAVPKLVLQRGVPGRVHWVSDFALPKACELPLFAMRRRGAKVTAWLPAIADDKAPPQRGYLRVVDPESGEELAVPIDAELRAELSRQLSLLARQQDRLFAQAGSALLRWPVPAANDFSFEAFQAIVAGCAR